MEQDYADRRKFMRLEINKRGTCKFLGRDGTRFKLLSRVDVVAHIVNLSAGGACISCDGGVGASAVQEESLIELEIPLKNGSVILSGRVAWLEKTESGIRAGLGFTEIGEDDRKKLVSYLNEELRFVRIV